MEPAKARTRFRWRALTSVLITAAFLILVVSGAILFLAPPGRIANWTNWSIIGMQKSEWAGLHISFSALFLIASVFHIIFNWRPLVGYFRTRWGQAARFRWEWPAALLISVGVYAGTRASLPPFSTLIAYSESLRESWEVPRQRAPIPHAELLTLQELAEKASLDMAKVTKRLQDQGITAFTTTTIVQDLANRSGMSAQKLYEIMTAIPPVGLGKGEGFSTGAGAGRGGGAGGGPGRKTLTDFCREEGIDLPTAIKRLETKGFKASTNLTLREIAENNGFSRPFELISVLRGETP